MTDTDREVCAWCERERELKRESENGFVFDGFSVAGPDGECFILEYGTVCHECWDQIREEWERTGTLTKPIHTFGGDE